ncbi:hypothetical protein ACHAXA_004825 [Cyclostephanos tholiformis]|uniref:6-phosphogluconate dehydrogenase, decarboxylating n=1 Tax=Cyclostephanos tholiformis TaxID=382380 RepID=A0ABD3SHG2_9STRA
MSCDVGLYGLAVMGQNFALNMASHGFRVCVGNRSPSKVELALSRAREEGDLPLYGSSDVEDFVRQLIKPRRVIILVQAGRPVDDTIALLTRYMEAGDVIIDGGNEWFQNTLRRSRELEGKGLHFVGMGISGGEEGARNGPCLMPGCTRAAYDIVEPILSKCAARVNDGPCSGYVGPVGSGNYVKMVHNGIEYGDMQLIGEVYDIMRTVLGLSNDEMAIIFDGWNGSELESYLIEITSKILSKRDDLTGEGHVVDYVLDKTGMKGTGRWTIQEAAERSVAAPTMAASLDARYISARKDERVRASTILRGPEMTSAEIPVHRGQMLDDLKSALYAAKVCSYAQGLGIIKSCSEDMNWNVSLSECARLWKGGCIIRAALLQKIQDALARDPKLPNLLLDPVIAAEMNERAAAWRRVIVVAIGYGVSTPALSGSLNYFDSYRRASLPANLTQAQRDFFGGHTYERTDRDGVFHTAWTDAHKSIGDITERKAGEI